MYKIARFGFDTYELQYDLGPGCLIDTKTPTKEEAKRIAKLRFDTIDDCLEYACDFIGTAFDRKEWCFEQDLDDSGNDGWVLHIIVENRTMKYATDDMIASWKKNDKTDLVDLLVNVFVEEVAC